MKLELFQDRQKAIMAFVACNVLFTVLPAKTFASSMSQDSLTTHTAADSITAKPVIAQPQQGQTNNSIVTGIITDEKGEPIIGAGVRIKGAAQGAITDMDGKFSLKAPAGSLLTVSYIGFAPKEVAATPGKTMNIQLQENAKKLDEVVVVGYGTQKMKDFTGSVTTLKIENSPVALTPTTNAMSMLRGTTPGITVSQEQGAGQVPSMQVRGQKSLNSTTGNPLLVVDGVIFMGEFRDIDPSNIASMSLLKDATSLAAYGSQAANGVLMITTKKGKLGKPVVSFNASVAIANAIGKPDLLSPEDYVKKGNLLHGLAEDAEPTWMKDNELANYKAGKTTDWVDFMTHTGLTQNYNVAVSGASEKLNYYMSGTYTNQKGVVIGDDYYRTALNTRLQSDVTSWLQFGGMMNYVFNNYSGPTNYNLYTATRLTPFGDAYRADGQLNRYPRGEGMSQENPLWGVKSGTIDDHDTYSTVNMTGHVLIKCPWIKGLSFRMNGTYSIENIERDYFTHEGYYMPENATDADYTADGRIKHLAQANGYSARTKNTYWVWDNILNYNHQFGKHYLDITYVYTRDSKSYAYRNFTGSDFSALGNSELGFDGLTYAAVQKITNIDKWTHNDVGYLGRVTYNFNDTYHFNASIRRDGSSVFGADNKWGWFPAVGAAWTMSNEGFMQKQKLINFWKWKVSWGINGNQTLNPYQTLSQLALGQKGGYSIPFGYPSVLHWAQRISSVGNADLGWEQTASVNYGIEVGMLNDRIHLNVDAYNSKTTHQIFNRTIPVMTNGLTSMKATMGRIDNWGIEINLSTVNIKSKDWSWTSALTYYLNRNKLVELYGDGKDDITNSLFLGKSLGAIYGYKDNGIVQAAYDQNGQPIYDIQADGTKKLRVSDADKAYAEANGAVPGDVKFVDNDGDGKITANDRQILGYTKENFRMSFANTVTWKNFELYLMFTGVFGGNGYGKSVNLYAYRTASDNPVDNNLNHGWWTAENRSNEYPSATYSDGKYTPVQGYGFVRLQNLNLSYSFKQPWVKKLGFTNLRAYMTATNVFTITGWKGGDPEVKQTIGTGYSYGYPLSRTFSFGINASF